MITAIVILAILVAFCVWYIIHLKSDVDYLKRHSHIHLNEDWQRANRGK